MHKGQYLQGRQYRLRLSNFIQVRNYISVIVLPVLMSMLTSCGGGSSSPVTTVSVGSGMVQVTANPGLTPSFDPNITDYVVAYKPGAPVQLTVSAPSSAKVTVAGQAMRSASTMQINLTPGQSFSFEIKSPASSRTYYVRCLPTDFPFWTTERPSNPQAEYYIIAPDLTSNGSQGHYVIVADNYGVPLWWYRSVNQTVDAKLLTNGNLAWSGSPEGEERRLNGSLVRTFPVPTSLGGIMDIHELLPLTNGDFLLIADVLRGPVDLTPYGGSMGVFIIDNIIYELSPNNTIVWQWSSMDHIPVSETDSRWWASQLVASSPADPYHMNSIEVDGSSLVVSFRYLDAVIGIDKASGNRLWKLGGTARPESLNFVGDSYGNFGGQHDARILPDGTLTAHDDGTLLGRGPRAVRYRLDQSARTATLVEQVTDPDVTSSICCGSVRKLSSGNWVMDWGHTPYVTELTASGQRVFRMTINAPYFSYRAVPILPGVLTREALRAGMDAQYPH